MSSLQRDIFLASEADQWFDRNKTALGAGRQDSLASIVERFGVKPRRVLEIGCANGWRLSHLKKVFGADCSGIDPSRKAIDEGMREFPGLDLRVGTSDKIDFGAGEFDLVIFGFCFYLIDPSLHFRCVAEADRVLNDGGFLIITDFLVPFPYHNSYSHLEGIKSFKHEFSRYFLAHPAYNLVYRTLNFDKGDWANPDRREGIDVLMKNSKRAFPLNPFSI